MTFLERWLAEGCSAENIGQKLKMLLKNQRWTELFCRDERDCYVGYCQSKLHMRKELEKYDIPYVSSVYNEELALQIIKKCVDENANQIAVWFAQPEKTKSFLCVDDTPIGIVRMQGSQDYTASFTALITIQKCGNSNRNRSGFYIESISVIPELPI